MLLALPVLHFRKDPVERSRRIKAALSLPAFPRKPYLYNLHHFHGQVNENDFVVVRWAIFWKKGFAYGRKVCILNIFVIDGVAVIHLSPLRKGRYMFNAMKFALVMVVTLAFCAMAADSTAAAKPAATTAVKTVEKKEAVAAPAKVTEPAKPAVTTAVKTVEKKEAVAATVKETEQKPVAATAVKMKISADGSAIVDEQGNEIAKFKEGIKVKAATQGKSAITELPGCMCCKDECLAYDKNGKCIKTYRSCTWDFDCNCKK